MKLIGSRARFAHDEFSDWDYVAETAADVETIERESPAWLCHTSAERGHLTILTVVIANGAMHDYDIAHANLRVPLVSARDTDGIQRFWVDNFRGLKAIARSYSLLFDMGLERCCGYLRGEVLKRELGTPDVCTFYTYGQHKNSISAFERGLADVTGLPYRTWKERVDKLRSLILLFETMFGHRPEIKSVFETRLKKAIVANKEAGGDT